MKTLTVTQARRNLGGLCEEAKKGGQIGIIWGNQVFMLLPVEVSPVLKSEISMVSMSDAYLKDEYGVTPEQSAHFKKQKEKQYKHDKKAGRIVSFKGKFNPSSLD